MDTRFHSAMEAIKAGDLNGLRSLILQDPSLATDRSSRSHPTLLQCLAIDAVDAPNKVEMAKLLIDAGSEINEPLIAAACMNNIEVEATLLDAGASINGADDWSPLEEALYWFFQSSVDLLLSRGATVHNLRIASGLGRMEIMESFFNADGSLKPEAGKITSPFGDRPTYGPQDVINNAFIYACMHGQIQAAKWLLEKGVEINAIPPGFDFAGTGLHYAALNGHQPMVEFLLAQGADPSIHDTKVDQTPAQWADFADHPEISDYLERSQAGALLAK